ncbi:MAG: hypothetical protein ACPGTQ_12120 [Colwellia sp.]
MFRKSSKGLLIPTVIALSTLTLISCGGSGDSEQTVKPVPVVAQPTGEVTPPATEHHETDGVKTQTTSQVTVASNTFTTLERNFSSETVVTDVMQVSSTVAKTHDIGKTLRYIGIQGDYLVGWEFNGAYDSKILSYSLVSNKILEEDNPDFNVSGLSFNGIIMSVDGAEDVNFYHMDKGVMGHHFFQIKDFTGTASKFLSTAYLDHNYAYVFNTDEVIRVHLKDTSKPEKVTDIPNFDKVTFTSDEKFLYIGDYDGVNDASVLILDKKNSTLANTLNLPGISVNSITVDANYIYISDNISKNVLIYNKHTLADSGSITVNAKTYIDYANGMLYIYRDDTQVVEEHTLSFAP